MNQITKNILMIRPSSFGYNEDTSKDNFFQSRVENMNNNEIKLVAIDEFENMCSILRDNGINIIVWKMIGVKIYRMMCPKQLD